MTQTHVLFHKSCTDGTGAKYAAWKKFGDKAKYTPVQYDEPLPPVTDGSDVFILDFSYPKDVLESLRARSKSILVLDHHKTAKAALEGLPYAKFDMHKSGAVLAWEHFHPGAPVPDLLLDIQDRDLWKWDRQNSAATHAGLLLTKNEMPAWDLAANSAETYNLLVGQGRAKLGFDELHIENQMKLVSIKELNVAGPNGTRFTYKTGLLNSTVLASEIGNAMCRKLGLDIAIIYFVNTQGQLILSFRSLAAPEGSNVDVSAICKEFGGGGHHNAAGTRLKVSALSVLMGDKSHLWLQHLKAHVIV